MSKNTTLTELRKLQLADLNKEVQTQQGEVAKLHLSVTLGKEKNSAKYQLAKKKLARIRTVQSEKRKEELQSKKQASTVSAPPTTA